MFKLADEHDGRSLSSDMACSTAPVNVSLGTTAIIAVGSIVRIAVRKSPMASCSVRRCGTLCIDKLQRRLFTTRPRKVRPRSQLRRPGRAASEQPCATMAATSEVREFRLQPRPPPRKSSFWRKLATGHAQCREDAGKRHGRRCLDIVVERADAVAILA